jgi:adenine deaminase
MEIKAQLVDVHKREVYPAIIIINDGRIAHVERISETQKTFIMPGLIDAHIHVESSMLTPSAFALTAVTHGTVGVVADPHEIANVLGIEGVKFMISDAAKVPFKFWFGAPSCVPATDYETNGATINAKDIEKLLKGSNIKYLAEMMNFPGVIFNDPEVIKKLEIAEKYGKPIDGHAPGLRGEMLKKYISAGISTDHECSNIEEAKEKIDLGMKILIREGSAARNLDALKKLLISNPDMIMLCSDDIHPEMLLKRHINKLISKLVREGFNLIDIIRSATVNPVDHYGLETGLLREGDRADFILVDSIADMNVLETWINGKKVFDRGKVLFTYSGAKQINNFYCNPIQANDLVIERKHNKMKVIKAFDGELITTEQIVDSGINSFVETNTSLDILKIVVKDRYRNTPPAVGFISGFGLKKGAFAGSIAHDSHNIIAIGVNDFDIVSVVNQIIKTKGGLAVSDGKSIDSVELNIAGIISDKPCSDVAAGYESLSNKVKALGCKLNAPFMTLSFMALLVIPELKIGDRGLFNVKDFKLTSLFV